MQSEWDEVRDALSAARERGITEVLAGNISHLVLARECGMDVTCDFRLNVSNRESRDTCLALGAKRIILSPELTLPMARDIGGGVTVLGRIPLMLTERCFIKENFGCEKCGESAFTDRMKERFPILREWKHRNLIMNSQPTYMGDKRSELASYGIRHEHVIISSESVPEACELMHAYNSGARLLKPHRRVGKR
jgi:collagenase-like PrtC family protease